ncbi:MAG TPA: helix-turn-helix domain-containing protein [Pseudonocardiaceae bacterium]|nr:helix-turn-helix domain-containing protein [Pseudonocardiaceae bacterium]
MSHPAEVPVPAELVQAAIRAAEERGEDVANVPLHVLAAAAGISRSTLVRRVGGSRRALDKAVCAAGVDPGGRQPVRRRAVEAAARLISEQGLAAVTLETVAAAAGCSVHSLYATFAGREGLLSAVYESYTPLFDIEKLVARPSSSLEQTVRGIYGAFAAGLGQQPRVAPAILADAFSRPDGAAGRLVQRYFSRAVGSVGGWLAAEVAAGRIRPMPVTLLIQQLLGPLMLHLLSRPLMSEDARLELPDPDEVCAGFAKAFVCAVGLPEGGPARTEPKIGGNRDEQIDRRAR